MAENCKKLIKEMLNKYNIENTKTNFNTIADILLDGEKVDVYQKFIQLAPNCIITDENKNSFTCEIELSKNKELLQDIQKLFVIQVLNQFTSDFRSNLFLRIKIYKKC